MVRCEKNKLLEHVQVTTSKLQLVELKEIKAFFTFSQPVRHAMWLSVFLKIIIHSHERVVSVSRSSFSFWWPSEIPGERRGIYFRLY